MKKLIFGGLLFIMGTLGVIAMIAAGINAGPWGFHFSGGGYIEGWFAAILGMRALAPFIVFCLIGAAGLALCVFAVLREDEISKQ